eukprot:CAMPEP_0206558198 /NCGR_PEP_ID=MMETSP0325_2-20121206/19607_1 /ASSEMBLY_ACC=CAM_ASM_000347 /TAXON_ID=2866 /ORGANISM="Crypthecodinium cohnii, Strain Seligo" /LENGTH=296 /DNA_ID=CAMNT_0054059365 /DNA_START=72 /DNA_END=963 /DNA_ORIENTATION=+
MASDMEKEAIRLDWLTKYEKAAQADTWGQVVEAQEDYQRLASNIASTQGAPHIASRDKDLMQKLGLCLAARIQALKTLNETITSTDMKALEPVFKVLFTTQDLASFPLESHKFSSAHLVKPSVGGGEVIFEGEDTSGWQQQQAVLKNVVGTVVSLRIDRIGLKDAQDYIDPFMTILVADPRTNLLDTHDTPIARERTATHLSFNHEVHLNISLEDMEREQAAIFFEFKHYKPKKKKVSTRCWAFMELSELKRDEEMVLEIYHKPTDLRKKSIKLHSEKTLYRIFMRPSSTPDAASL